MTAGPFLPIRLAALPRQRMTSPPPSALEAPGPAAGPPSQAWIHRSSHRRRLEFGFAMLRQHGIQALPGLGQDDPHEPARADQGPYAAFLFSGPPSVTWSPADDRTCFTSDGRLQADLPLQVHGVIAPLLSAALAAVGLIGRPDPVTGRYVVLHAIPF